VLARIISQSANLEEMVRAVIFDLDGTILDNEGLYGKAFCAVLRKLGISCEKVKHTSGIGVLENWGRMKRELNLAQDPADLSAQTQQYYLDHIGQVEVRPGFIETARYLKEKGIKVVLATSNTTDVGKKILEELRIEKIFDALTFGDEVDKKKPAPDIFLKALERVGFRRGEAVVIEDSPAGIAAAKNALIKVFAIKTDRFNRIQLARANQTIDRFEELKEIIR
jgi:beta-phosphoglucomutase